MKQLTQKHFNEVADYYYKLQRDETNHQSNRMNWIIAAQALVFTGICALVPNKTIISNGILTERSDNVLLWLLIIVGVLTSISAVYSLSVSEISIGSILDDWHDYDSLNIRRKPNPIAHKVIVAPNTILECGLKWLALHTFVPKVFASAWFVLLFYTIGASSINFTPLYTTFYFMVALLVIHIIAYCYKSHKKNRIVLDKVCRKLTDMENQDCKCCQYEKCCCNKGQYFCCGRCGCSYCCSPCSGILKCNNTFCCNHVKPQLSTLAIYHLVIDRFNGGWTKPPKSGNIFLNGNIQGIIEKLYYIKSQGYNAIMMTPFYTSEEYHGYHITNYEAIDKRFGNWKTFEQLVCQAHKIGLKVICDFVPNHCHENHPFFQNALLNGNKRDWFCFNADGTYNTFGGLKILPKFNLKNTETAEYFIDRAVDLAKRGVDGLRIDHAVGVPFEFLRDLRKAVKCVNENFFVIGEVLPVSKGLTSLTEVKHEIRRKQMEHGICEQDDLQLDYIDVLDGVLDFTYRDIILEELKKGGDIDYSNPQLMKKLKSHFSKYSKNFFPIIFLDNHDVDRIMFNCNRDKSLVDKVVAFTKSLCMPYSIYYGTEQYMCNKHSLSSGIPYVDLEVREPMDWE